MHLHRSMALIGVSTLWLPTVAVQAAPQTGCAHPARAQIIGSSAWLDYCVFDGQALIEDIILGEHQQIQDHGVRLPVVIPWQRASENQQRDTSVNHATELAKRRGKRAATHRGCVSANPGYPHTGGYQNHGYYPGLIVPGYSPNCAGYHGNCTGLGGSQAHSGQYTGPNPNPVDPQYTSITTPRAIRQTPGATPRTNRYGNTTWPQNTVYYALDQASPGTRAAIHSAITEIESHTHVRFVLRSHQPDYINVITKHLANRCGTSYLGKIGGGQALTIDPECETTGTALHEIQHALGFPHQHIQDNERRALAVEQLTQAEIQGINASYPPVQIARTDSTQAALRRVRYLAPSMPGPQINHTRLEIDQNGLGKAQIYIDGPQTKLLRMGPDNPRLGNIQTVAKRVSDRQYTITLIPPPSFVGHSRLSFTFINQTGQTRTVSLDLQVKAKGATPWRQLVSRHGYNQCLSAGASSSAKLSLYPCIQGSRQQQWKQHASGQIESLAHNGFCLTPNSAIQESPIALSPCTPYAREQRWKKTATQWFNAANPQLSLSLDRLQRLILYPLVHNAQWQAWDWR